MTKINKQKKIPKRFFENERLEIGKVLIDELTDLECPSKFTEEEFLRLVDRLYKISPPLLSSRKGNKKIKRCVK